MQISQVMMSYAQPHFDQINKDISANLYNKCFKCLNFYSEILLEVLRSMSLTIFVTMAT